MNDQSFEPVLNAGRHAMQGRRLKILDPASGGLALEFWGGSRDDRASHCADMGLKLDYKMC